MLSEKFYEKLVKGCCSAEVLLELEKRLPLSPYEIKEKLFRRIAGPPITWAPFKREPRIPKFREIPVGLSYENRLQRSTKNRSIFLHETREKDIRTDVSRDNNTKAPKPTFSLLTLFLLYTQCTVLFSRQGIFRSRSP